MASLVLSRKGLRNIPVVGRLREEIYCGAIFLLSVIVLGNGIPTITSNIQPLSGELCPDGVTFSCNWLEAGSPIIDWYLGDTQLFRYEYNPQHTFPYLVNTSLPALMAQISSANFSFNQYDYENFTFSADLNYILQYQGQFLTCGTFLQRSTPIDIGNLIDSGLGDDLEVWYTAHYDEKQELVNITLQWNNETSLLKCDFMITYVIEIEVNDSVIFNCSRKSADCDNLCSVNYYVNMAQSNSDSISKYVVRVYRTSAVSQKKTQVSSTELLASGTSIFENNLQDGVCQPFIKCPSFSVDGCNISYGYDSNSYNRFENSTWASNTYFTWLNLSQESRLYVKVVAFTNWTILIQRFNFSVILLTKNSDVPYLVVGYITLGIATALLIIGYGYCAWITFSLHRNQYEASWRFKKMDKSGQIYHTSLLNHKSIITSPSLVLMTVFHCFTAGICVLSWILWVIYHTTYTRDFCGNDTHQTKLAVSAIVFSLLGGLISVLSAGGLFIIKVQKVEDEQEEEPESTSEIFKMDDLTFGRKLKPVTNNRRCVDCGSFIFIAELCLSCSKNMCLNCGRKFKAYIPRLKENYPICKSCDEIYWNENYKLSMNNFFMGNNTSQFDCHNSSKCAVCNCELEKLITCSLCNKNVCKKHYGKTPNIKDKTFRSENNIEGVKNCCSHCHEKLSRKYHVMKRLMSQNMKQELKLVVKETANKVQKAPNMEHETINMKQEPTNRKQEPTNMEQETARVEKK